MGGIFGGKQKVSRPVIPPPIKLPPTPDPVPTPEPLDEEAIQKSRAKRRQRLAARGRAGTILTEGLGGQKEGSSLLGGGL